MAGERRQHDLRGSDRFLLITGEDMKPRIKVITLGVSDLQRSTAFYRDGMGLPTQGIIGTEFEDGAVVFFDMNDDLILALYPKAALAKDAKVSVGPPNPAEISIGHIVRSKRDVDAVMKQAGKAGAKITDPAHDRFWGGYSGYFQDLDGHLWEIAWNPDWDVEE
jgi:catechol 2,3-dioxygenase-like lactoylglutathione lyase family enzyme